MTAADDLGFYLIHMPDGEVVCCAGDVVDASNHLTQLRDAHYVSIKEATGRPPEVFPWLIGVYPPTSVGGPTGKGGVYSYGYRATKKGAPGSAPHEWEDVV
jgi:hypothetical protein